MTEKTGSYKDLIVWQQAMDLAVAVYGATKSWPKEEIYGLTSQVRRAASSVPANIAEGYGREVRGSYQQFLRIAQGSLKELETQLLIAERTGIASNGTSGFIIGEHRKCGKASSTSDPQTFSRLASPYCLTALLPYCTPTASYCPTPLLPYSPTPSIMPYQSPISPGRSWYEDTAGPRPEYHGARR